jgi:DNA-binding CsgD family transcriptional regulator
VAANLQLDTGAGGRLGSMNVSPAICINMIVRNEAHIVQEVRAHSLASECGSVYTPALAELGSRASVTGRQREITALAAQGLTNKEIAKRLNVSVRTVESHLYRASTKTGATGRAELAAGLNPRKPKD